MLEGKARAADVFGSLSSREHGGLNLSFTSSITPRGHVDWLADSRLMAPVVRQWIETGKLATPESAE
jgi:hypothetical protein